MGVGGFSQFTPVLRLEQAVSEMPVGLKKVGGVGWGGGIVQVYGNGTILAIIRAR